MKFKVLKKDNLKRNIIVGAFVVLIISAVILNFSSARYRSTASVPIVNSTVNYKAYDLKVLAMYQENEAGEYVSIDVMPSSGYVINESESYCTVDGINKDNNARLYTNDNGEHVIANLQKKSKCYLYFDEYINPYAVRDYILANKTIATRNDFSTAVTEDTTGIIYQDEDDDGTTYYYAGAPTDNWVYFAGYYWRIIRINGDGTLRVIYAGTNPNITTCGGTQIGTSTFNRLSNDNMYVGYMYTSGEVHGLETNSTIKGVLDTWYVNNLASYANHIDINAGFCNDRSLRSGTGIGTTETTYNMGINPPSFKCPELSYDLFTISTSIKGNRALTYPIGLITAPEAMYAGSCFGMNESNTSYYLYTGQSYWTMTPSYFSSDALGHPIRTNGSMYLGNLISSSNGVRPVINLRADTQFTGSGTSSDPFVVV